MYMRGASGAGEGGGDTYSCRMLCVRSSKTIMCHSLRLPLVRNVKHIAADVDTKPNMSGLLQRFAAEPAPATHVEDKARLPWLR